MSADFFFNGAPLTLRAGLRRKEGSFLSLPGIYSSARVARHGNMPGYYQAVPLKRDWGWDIAAAFAKINVAVEKKAGAFTFWRSDHPVYVLLLIT